MTDTLGLDWEGAQSLPPTKAYIMQKAANLIDFKRGVLMELHADFKDYAYVIARGPECQVPPEAISFARKMLTEAADANRGVARTLLTEVDAYLAEQAERQRAEMAS